MEAFDGNLERYCWSVCFSCGNRKNSSPYQYIGKIEVGKLATVGYSCHVPVFNDEAQ